MGLGGQKPYLEGTWKVHIFLYAVYPEMCGRKHIFLAITKRTEDQLFAITLTLCFRDVRKDNSLYPLIFMAGSRSV